MLFDLIDTPSELWEDACSAYSALCYDVTHVYTIYIYIYAAKPMYSVCSRSPCFVLLGGVLCHCNGRADDFDDRYVEAWGALSQHPKRLIACRAERASAIICAPSSSSKYSAVAGIMTCSGISYLWPGPSMVKHVGARRAPRRVRKEGQPTVKPQMFHRIEIYALIC